MAYDYDKLYGDTPDALGAPTPLIVQAFAPFADRSLRVLDVGCGQGRDALFIARAGHWVTGVDLSPNGIRDLAAAAAAEGLPVMTHVADIVTFVPNDIFDVVLIDRTLHMLAQPDRTAVLARLLRLVTANGWVMIADEPGNMPDLTAVLSADARRWSVDMKAPGFLVAQVA